MPSRVQNKRRDSQETAGEVAGVRAPKIRPRLCRWSFSVPRQIRRRRNFRSSLLRMVPVQQGLFFSLSVSLISFVSPEERRLTFEQEFTEYTNFDECLAYIEDFMIKHGPFDGLLGFSQVQLFFQ
jgi:hypothetical protein